MSHPENDRKRPDADSVDALPRTFGDYEILEEIGRGGMGVVYKARQTSLGRLVCLKMILAGELAHDEDVQRFHAEAAAAARLDHAGIVPIHEIGELSGRHYFSMAFIEGQTLTDVVRDHPLDNHRAAHMTAQIAQAIGYGHGRGVVHRDLKPDNILIDSEGKPHVTDFGLAKRTDTDSQLTQTGQILGTPNYMAPEQAVDVENVGPLSDVYALGALLYFQLTGRPPFQAASVMDTLQQVLDQDAVPPRALNAAIDRDLETICIRCLQKDPSRRYRSADALADDLERYLGGHPIEARPVTSRERLGKWTRRNPGLAALSGSMVAAAILLVVLFGSWWRAASREATTLAQLNSQQKKQLEQRQIRLDQANEAAEKMRLFLTPVAEAIGRTEKAARRVQAMQQVRAINVALRNYHQVFRTFPTDYHDAEGKPLLSWRVRILPYLEEGKLYEQFRVDEPWDSAHNKKLLAKIPDVYARVVRDDQSKLLREGGDLAARVQEQSLDAGQEFDEKLTVEYIQLQFTKRILEFMQRSKIFGRVKQPSPAKPVRYQVDTSEPLTYFQGFEGPGTMFERGKKLRLADVLDGTSNTIMIVESFEPVPWTKPGGLPFDPKKPLPKLGGLGFEGLFHVGYVDGSVKAVKADFDRRVLKGMATRNGFEPVK